MSRYELGFIHGRFQVLHNDHLKYLLAGKALCDELIVGITNPDPVLTRPEDADPQRSDPASNPLTYRRRSVMVREVLTHAGLDLREFTVTPFPVTMPELYAHYAPMDAVFFLTIYDEWGRTKKNRFESMGLRTHVLWERPAEKKGISGQEVRKLIRTNGNWQSLVPPPVVDLVEKWRLNRA